MYWNRVSAALWPECASGGTYCRREELPDRSNRRRRMYPIPRRPDQRARVRASLYPPETWFGTPSPPCLSTANETHCPYQTDQGSACCSAGPSVLLPEPPRHAIALVRVDLHLRRREI